MNNRTIVETKEYKGINIYVVNYHIDMPNLGVEFYSNPNWTCGYIDIPKDYKEFEVNYNNLSSEYHNAVHGGLTYSKFGLGKEVSETKWMLGWDYNHFEDHGITPAFEVVEDAKKLIDVIVNNNI